MPADTNTPVGSSDSFQSGSEFVPPPKAPKTPGGPPPIKPPSRRRGLRKWIYGGAAVVVVLGVGIPVALAKERGSNSLANLRLYTVGYGDVSQSISTSGSITAPTSLDLNFQGASSVVTSIPVKVGQVVKKGQILATLDNATEQIAVEQAESGVKQAEASLQSAEAHLASDEQGPTSVQLALDKEDVVKAQSSLAAAQQQYQEQESLYSDRTSQEQAVEQAKNALAQAKLAASATDSTVTLAQQKLSTDQATLASDQTTLQQTEAQYGNVTEAQVQAAYEKYQNELSFENSWANAGYAGQNPYTAATSQDESEYQEVDSAYQALQSAQQAVTNAQDQVASDQSQLAADQASETQSQQQAQQTVTADEEALQIAEEEYNNRTSAEQALESAKSNVTSAEEALKTAQLTLENDEAPASAATIASDEASVASAQASVTNAEASLQTAELNNSETVLRAPISGVVTEVNGVVGETPSEASAGSSSGTSSSGAFIVMDDMNSHDLDVTLDVAESQIGSVHAGESLTLTVPAYPNKTFTGTITQVYPTPQVVSNVTEFTVVGTVSNASGLLKPGMTASADVQTASVTHVLTIPAIALQQVGSVEGVYVEGKPSKTAFAAGGFGKSGSGKGGFGKGNFGKGGSSGATGGFSKGGFGGGAGAAGGSTKGGFGGFAGASGASHGFTNKNLPAGVYFQPVQLGLQGSYLVQVTSGLSAGEKILLTLPGKTASALVASQSSGHPFFGGGFGGGRG